MFRRGLIWVAAVAAIVLWSDGDAAESSIKPAPAFTPKELMTLPHGNWITNGGTIYNQRYSPLTQISKDNVAGLKAEWHISLGGSGAGAVTP